MSEISIKVENLSKVYKLYDTPQDRLKEAISPIRKKYHNDFYALQDINFEILKGETVGIIGRNGSGKSTLLKIITGVLTPTTGSAYVNGRISALLELGTGFNPELTGIDNVYFNGMLMGFSKEEMNSRLDSILSFADIGDFIHQPVKTYSSGMFVRLAFAVQALVNPEILIVDEALAVGDSLFQKRCYQKMEELISNGTTLLFVSHDQESIRTLTSRAILLNNGKQHMTGTSSEVMLEYRRLLHKYESGYLRAKTAEVKQSPAKESPQSHARRSDLLSFGDGDAEVLEVKVLNIHDQEDTVFYPGDLIRIRLTSRINKSMSGLNVGIRIRNKEGIKLYSWGTLNQDQAIWAGITDGDVFWEKQFEAGEVVTVTMECSCLLGQNLYEVQAHISEETDKYYGAQRMLHWQDEAAFFRVAITRDYQFGGVSDLKMKALF
ncbi:ABC transporter ATP-binding protein [Geomonas ferrireducens]|uniref:ABC transporter ATP-binding protein n=1 Tax=Geomonas ferrireducens TaxID=2570227 RepID=UPI0010A8262C|nr:ABC transporter ATP-binding protein [Geomonas ferrireducens]